MSPTTQIIGKEELLAKFKALGEVAGQATLERAVVAGGLVIQNAAKAKVKDNALIKTGNLRRSIHMEMTDANGKSATLEIGTDVEYAAVHEFGGVITPKKGKYLAIPVGNYKDSPLNHKNLRAVKTRAGNLVLMDRDGTVQYVLKTSVTIPAKPYLRPAMDEHQSEAEDEVGKVFKQLIEQAAV